VRGYISGEFPNALLYHILGIKGSEHSLNFPFLRPTHTLCGDNISSLLIHVIKIQALSYNDLCRRNISPLLIHAVKIQALFYNGLCRRNTSPPLIHAVKIQALFYNGLCRRNTSPPLIHAVKILAPLYNGLSKSGIPRQASKRLQAWKRQKYIFPPIFALQWVSFYR